MITVTIFALLLLAGFGLGLLFFGGLWMTVQAIPRSHHPAALGLASFWGRAAVVVAGLLFIMDGSWPRALAGLVGFVCARIAIGRWAAHKDEAQSHLV